MSLSEREKVQRLASLFGANVTPGITLGIGDDAAVLAPPGTGSLVWTVDVQVEGVHFRRAWMSAEDLGWRSFVAAVSDVSAMGGTPWCALSALVLPSDWDDEALDGLARGQAAAARETGCPMVGGNLSRGGELSVTTTVLGTATSPVARNGARAGDGVWLLGDVGLAGAGFHALSKGIVDARTAPAIEAFRRPRPRIAGGVRLGGRAHAAIDVSDGLATDAERVAEASGVGIVFDEALLLSHAGAIGREAAEAVAEPLLELMLTGGEDYALLAASPERLSGFTRVGEVRPGAGVWLRRSDGEVRLEGKGFDHFAP